MTDVRTSDGTSAAPERSRIEDLSQTLRRSFAYCHRVTRTRARNFYYGLKLTPEPKRSALYVIYAFMRACDDLADEPRGATGNADEPGTTGLARLEQFNRQLQSVVQGGADPPDIPVGSDIASTGLIWPAFNQVMRTYPINIAYLQAMLEGQRCDLQQRLYRTFDDLRDYCYKVASVVGLVCISVWGYGGGEQTRQLARDRGIALQLTNILRDLVEDARRDRLYLPVDELQQFGIDPPAFTRQLASGQASGSFDQLMGYQIDRARRFYESSRDLERWIDAPCRPTSWAIMRIYRGLLEKIAKNPRRVLTSRVRLSSPQKLGIAMRAMYQRGLARS